MENSLGIIKLKGKQKDSRETKRINKQLTKRKELIRNSKETNSNKKLMINDSELFSEMPLFSSHQ